MLSIISHTCTLCPCSNHAPLSSLSVDVLLSSMSTSLATSFGVLTPKFSIPAASFMSQQRRKKQGSKRSKQRRQREQRKQRRQQQQQRVRAQQLRHDDDCGDDVMISLVTVPTQNKMPLYQKVLRKKGGRRVTKGHATVFVSH